METACNDAVLAYLDDSGQQHTILRGLDQVQKAAYAGG
jgi:hypothetical protein